MLWSLLKCCLDSDFYFAPMTMLKNEIETYTVEVQAPGMLHAAQQFAASSHYSRAKHIAKNLLFLLFSLIINSLFAA